MQTVQSPTIDLMISSILYLMTRYSLSQETGVAEMITSHLALLAEHPENQSDAMQDTCIRLSEKWQSIIAYQEFNPNTVC